MKKYIFKPAIALLLFIFLAALVINCLLNNFLASSKDKLESAINDLLNQRVRIESISFAFPNSVIIKNAYIINTGNPELAHPVIIKRIRCAFSLTAIAIKRNLIITKVGIDTPTLDYVFIKENFEAILEAILTLFQEQPLKMEIKHARLNLPSSARPKRQVILDAALWINGKTIFSKGAIALEGFMTEHNFMAASHNNEPGLSSLNYNLRVFLTRKGFIIEGLDLQNESLHLRFSGELENELLTIHGTSSLSSFPDLDIYDITCVMKFDLPNIEIKNLGFSLGNMPLLLRGGVALTQPPTLNLKLSSFPAQPRKARFRNPEAFDVSIKGRIEKDEFSGSTALVFLRKTKSKASQEKLEAILDNLKFHSDDDRNIRISCDKANVSYSPPGNVYNIFLKQLTAILYPEDKKIIITQLNSVLYDGFFKAEGIIDLTKIPFKSSLDISISDISANQLHSLIPHCSKIYGTLSSQIRFSNYPNLILTGDLIINNGLLDNIIFFEWIANFLGLPSLRLIKFERLAAGFTVNDEGVKLDTIHLDSDNVRFDGNFTLNEDDLVSSRLSLALDKELFKKSRKLLRLINYLRQDISSLGFSFQLSGFFQSMNFQWLDSDFKQGLKDLLPSNTKRKLERKIGKIIESIFSQ